MYERGDEERNLAIIPLQFGKETQTWLKQRVQFNQY